MKQGTKREPKDELNANRGLSRGVRLLKPREGRPKPYGVQWRENGRVKTEFFRTAEDRNRRASAISRAKSEGLPVIPREEAPEWLAFKSEIGSANWRDVVAGWRSWQQKSGTADDGLTANKAAAEYLAFIQKLTDDKSLSPDTQRQRKQKVEAFSAAFGGNPLSGITAEDIEDWIDELGFDSPHTFNTYRKIIRSFFDHFRDNLPKNPCDNIRTRNDKIESVGILTPQQTAKLFLEAMRSCPEILGRLATEAFAGLRFSSAYRLEKADINFADRGVLLPRHKIKTGRRHYIDGLPENLWEWMKMTNDACWALTPRQYAELKCRLFKTANVPHPRNCLRHSFCTYHVAAFKNPGLTASILCHRNQQQLWEHYNGNATQADGRLYWTITPQSAEGLADSESDKSPQASQ